MFFLQISSEEINQNSLKCQIYQTLKKGQIIGARMAGASVTKSAELFGVARSSLENNDSIWERRKGLFIEAKLWMKAKAVW